MKSTIWFWCWLMMLASCIVMCVACFNLMKQNEVLREQLREFVKTKQSAVISHTGSEHYKRMFDTADPWLTNVCLFSLRNAGTNILSIDGGGNVEFGPGVEPSEAAKVFAGWLKEELAK